MTSTRRAEILKHAFIWLVLAFAFFPLYVMLNISLKDNTQFLQNPWLPDGPYHWENWETGWYTIKNYIANSVVVAVGATALTLTCALGAAYFFARYRMPLCGVLWSLLLVLMMMPTVANLIPLFTLLKSLHLLNRLWALVIVGAAGGQVVCVYILRNFIEDIPRDLFDAAEVDGANHLGQIRHIVVPLSGSILSTLAILQFIGNWNNFILPLIVLRDDYLLTIPVGLVRLEGEYVKQYGPMMAGYAIASIPLVLLFLFTMRLFVRGLSAGAIKG